MNFEYLYLVLEELLFNSFMITAPVMKELIEVRIVAASAVT